VPLGSFPPGTETPADGDAERTGPPLFPATSAVPMAGNAIRFAVQQKIKRCLLLRPVRHDIELRELRWPTSH